MNAYTVETEMEMAVNETEIVRTHRKMSKTRNSPYTYEIVMSNPTYQWKRVSDGNGDVYVPWNAPVRAQGRIFAFGEVESGEKAIAPSLEGERTVGGDGDPNGGDGDSGDGDGTASGNGIDSSRVKAVWLAGESQHMHWSRRK